MNKKARLVDWKVHIYFIIAIAIILRFWGITWGLPYLYHPDEGIMVKIAFGFRTGDLNPHNFLYPTFSMYLLFFVYAIWYLVGTLLNYFTTIYDFELLFNEHVEYFYLVARVFTASFGVITVVFLYKLIKLHFGKYAAILASLFLSISYLHVQNSKYATVDVPLVFFTVLALYFILMISIRNNQHTYILAGIFSGCAITTKQTGIFLIIPLLVAHYLYSGENKNVVSRLFSKKVAFYFLALIITLFITSPYIFLDFMTFWDYATHQSSAMKGWLGSEVNRFSWIYYFKLLSVDSKENIGVLILAAFGVLFGVAKKRKETIIFIVFPMIYFFIVGSWKTHFPRYALPLIPFIAGFAGIGASYLITNSFFKKKMFKNSFIGFLIIILVANIAKAVMLDNILINKDTRTVAKEWIEDNLPTGSRIAYETYAPQLHIRNSGKFELINMGKIISQPLDYYIARDVDYVIISGFYKNRYYRAYKAVKEYPMEIYRYENLKNKAELIKVFRTDELLSPGIKIFLGDFFEQEILNCRHYPTIEIYKI